MIVLGIIALLAALLFPVFSRVREKGRQTVCLSNERQLGLAFYLHAQDYDDYTALGADVWAGSLYPYVKNVDVFHCPSDPTDAHLKLLPPQQVSTGDASNPSDAPH